MPVDVEKSGLVYRIWPAFTAQWFTPSLTSAGPVFGDLHAVRQLGLEEDCTRQIRGYLEGLLGYRPPDEWLEGKQLEVLFEELKHLVGETSASQGARGRNLTTGTAGLLLAAVEGRHSEEWVTKWKLTELTEEILPKQSRPQAAEAITALVSLLSVLASNRADQRFTRRVSVLPSKLVATVDVGALDFIKTLPEREAHDDELSHSFAWWNRASRQGIRGGSEARSVLNIMPAAENGTESLALLEILVCR